MKIDRDTGSEGASGNAASLLPAAQRTGGGWKEPGDTGTNWGHWELDKEGFGISVLG